MEKPDKASALILEKEDRIAHALSEVLRDNSYSVIPMRQDEDLFQFLEDHSAALALIGESEEGDTVFSTMKRLVMTAPMTAIILITNRPEEEVTELAEGYGILGHVGRDQPAEDLVPLLERFQEISQSLGPAKT
jgi:DNA-binding NtrC family response regulator